MLSGNDITGVLRGWPLSLGRSDKIKCQKIRTVNRKSVMVYQDKIGDRSIIGKLVRERSELGSQGLP